MITKARQLATKKTGKKVLKKPFNILSRMQFNSMKVAEEHNSQC